MELQNWILTDCADKEYPVVVRNSLMMLVNRRKLALWDDHLLYNEWGKPNAIEIPNENCISGPLGFGIKWYSVIERSFYEAVLEFDYQNVEELLNKGCLDPLGEGIVPFDYVLVGIGPGGLVVVWAGAHGNQKIIGKQMGEKAEVPWNEFKPNSKQNEEEYREELLGKLGLSTVMESAQILERKRYWLSLKSASYVYDIKIIADASSKKLSVVYVNGEEEYQKFDEENPLEFERRGVPRSAELSWEWNGIDYFSRITFDVEETKEAFEKLIQSKDLELQILVSSIQSKVELNLVTKDNYIRLKKTVTRVFH